VTPRQPPDFPPNRISVRHASSLENQRTTRYRWRNHERTDENCVTVQLTLRGTGWIELGGVRREVPAGRAFVTLIPEPSEYGYPETARGAWEFCWVNFEGDWARRLWAAFRARHGVVAPLRADGAGALLRMIARRAADGRWGESWEASAACYQFYAAWREELENQAGQPPLSLEEAHARLLAAGARPWRVKELATCCGLSREHFTRLFRKRFGESPGALARRARLTEAAGWLRSGRLPVREIAQRLGFASAPQFAHLFRKEYGRTPSALRAAPGRRN
jgi:AraC-like DNA-binding protein